MSPRRFLGFLILNFLVAGVALQYVSVYLYQRGRIPAYCDGTVIHPLHDMVSRYQESDSWFPMMEANDARRSPQGIYRAVFYDQRTKFQYPLASLIPIALLRAMSISDDRLLDILKWVSIVAFLAQIPVTYAVVRRAAGDGSGWPLTLGLAFVLVISFYPLVRAYAAGQIQIFLDLLFSVAFLSWIDKKSRLSGVLMGLAMLVKPQYGLFVLWAVVRKNWRFLLAALATLAAGAVLAVALYGWRNNVQYLEVLRFMSRHGEAYYPNQSINGLLNRLLKNGSNTQFDVHGFAPFLPVVYFLTGAASLGIVAFAIFSKRPKTEFGRICEFGVIAIASTAASPIAWEHHYGILLPLFAWVLPQMDGLRRVSGAVWMLPVSFVLCADDLRMTNLLASSVPWNVFQSTLMAGAMVLFLYLRRFARVLPEPLIRTEPFVSTHL